MTVGEKGELSLYVKGNQLSKTAGSEKTFDKIQHPLMIKTLSKLGNRQELLRSSRWYSG